MSWREPVESIVRDALRYGLRMPKSSSAAAFVFVYSTGRVTGMLLYGSAQYVEVDYPTKEEAMVRLEALAALEGII